MAKTLAERFWSKVDKRGPDECWNWTASLWGGGYGQFMRKGSRYAHHVSWELTNGSRGDKCVLHKCDNPRCVNPRHLFLGSLSDNTQDMMRKGRHRPAVLRGTEHKRSKLSEHQVRLIRTAYNGGWANGVELARMYGVSSTIIYGIVKGRSWKHVA